MKAASGRRPAPGIGMLISLTIMALAIVVGWYLSDRSSRFPSTDDATIDADVVHVASTVGGRIIKIAVAENGRVSKGDLLFQIDPTPYELAVAQTRADLKLAEATLETQGRAIATQQSAAAIAGDQTKRARTNYELATRTVQRLEPLAAKGYVPAQQLDRSPNVTLPPHYSRQPSRRPLRVARSTRWLVQRPLSARARPHSPSLNTPWTIRRYGPPTMGAWWA